MTFRGYTRESMAFLAALPTRDPEWFKANKSTYNAVIVNPTKGLVEAIGDGLSTLVPDIVAQPKTNGSIAPINNDLRFSPDKSPYKDHLLLRFWEGAPKKTAPTLFLRVASDSVGIATGVVPADVERWRAAVGGDAGAELAAAISDLVETTGAEVAGQELKRVPAPYDPGHARADLLRHKMLQVRWSEPLPGSFADSSFVDWCLDRLELALPVHCWLVTNLQRP